MIFKRKKSDGTGQESSPDETEQESPSAQDSVIDSNLNEWLESASAPNIGDEAEASRAKEKRRFPRICLQSADQGALPLHGAKMIWPNGSRVDVLDLSYIGAAVRPDEDVIPAVGDSMRAHLELDGFSSVEVLVEVVRIVPHAVALRFGDLPAESRHALDRFLHNKLIGANMRAIEAKYYDKQSGFTHWFHGPNNANVFLWYDALALQKAVVELGDGFLRWKHNRFFTGISQPYLDEEHDAYFKPLLDERIQTERETEGLTPLMARVLDLLLQIQDPEKVLLPLIKSLSARQSASGAAKGRPE